jgi:hypothetical protein
MISIDNYNKEDLLLVKGHFLVFVSCLVLIGGIFWATRYIDNSAEAELQQVRSQITGMRNSIDRIQLEEGVARQYVNQYQTLQTNGVVGDEDRLHLLELLSQIRAQRQLFPININIHEQAQLTLPYGNNTIGTGQPVQLRSSVLDINFPLLHEEDLSRLMSDLLGSRYFLQPASCRIDDNNEGNTTYYYLDKHFNASCSMYWYTFNITPVAEAPP